MEDSLSSTPVKVACSGSQYNRYTDNIFTFYVGPPKERFMVHSDIVSLHSTTLCQIMNGPFREGIERCAELPDVDPGTFGRFLTHAYSTTNNTSASEAPTSTRQAQHVPMSCLVELLLKNEHKKYNCKQCHRTPSLQLSYAFPLCDTCIQEKPSSLTWSRHCVVDRCARDGAYIYGIFCEECLRALGVFDRYTGLTTNGAKKVQLDRPVTVDNLQNFHFNIPLRANDLYGDTQSRNLLPDVHDISLIDTARIAIFADIYAVQSLSQAALATLHWKLSQRSLDTDGAAAICELTGFIYGNTMDRPQKTSVHGTHTLRRILSQFIATFRDQFTSSPEFMQLVAEEGQLSGDILLALSVVMNSK